MLSDDELRRFYVGLLGQAEIEVGGKIFKIVGVEKRGEEIFLKIYCTDFDPNNTTLINAEAGDAAYLEAYKQLKQQARGQRIRRGVSSAPQEVEGKLPKIEPELPYIRSESEMIGKAMSLNSESFGITKDNVDKVHVKISDLRNYIINKRLNDFVSKFRLKENDAPPINRYVSRCAAKKMNIIELIEWEKKINGINHALNVIWIRYSKRIKDLIKVLMQVRSDYRNMLDKEGFKNWKAAESLYVELRSRLEPKKLKIVCKVEGRSNREIQANANKKIKHWQAEDITWMHYWNCLAATVYFINRKLIPRINQAISRQGQQVRRQGREKVPEAAPQGEPPELEE